MRKHARLRAPDLARDDHVGRLLFDVLELGALGVLRLGDIDAVEAVQKVDVPPVAAELAVRDRLQPDVFLELDDVADVLVLGVLQLRGRDLAFLGLGARLVELFRPKKAAYVISTERRLAFHPEN